MASHAAAAQQCPSPMKPTSNGVFQGDNPLDFAPPLAILQICLVIAVTRGLAFILRPIRQPRVIAEIIGGIFLGPSALGRSSKFLMGQGIGIGSSFALMVIDDPIPSTKGKLIPARAMLIAFFPVRGRDLGSNSRPTRNRKNRRPRLAKVSSTVRLFAGKTVFGNLLLLPRADGPKKKKIK